MPLDFPSSPTNGQVYGNYYYNSARGAWNALLPAATPNFFTNATLNTSTLIDAIATASATSTTPLIINGLSGQTANLQEWRNATGIAQSLVNSSGNIFVGSTQSNYTTTTQVGVKARAAGQIPLSIQAAASQTANLQEWQNSGGTVLSSVSSSGLITAPSLTVNSSASINSGAAGTIPLIVKAAASQTADIQQWQSSTGAVLSDINSAGELQVPRIGVGSVMPTTTMFQSTASAVGNIPIVARGIASQTANLQEWQDSTATVRASISPTGALTLATPLAIASGGTGVATGSGLVPIVPASVVVGSGSATVSASGLVTFSNATSFSLDNIFTNSYRTYKINITLSGNTAGAAIYMRLRAAGSEAAGAAYYYAGSWQRQSNTTYLSWNGNGTTFFDLGRIQSTSAIISFITMDITNPFVATRTNYTMSAMVDDNSSPMWINSGGVHASTTAFDAVTIYPTSGNFSGTIQVYGYR